MRGSGIVNRRQYGLVLACLVAAFIGGGVSNWALSGRPLFAQQETGTKKVVTAERFCIVDDRGNMRAILGVGDDGRVYIGFFDKHDRPRAIFGISSEDSPVLTFTGTDGKARVALGQISRGWA